MKSKHLVLVPALLLPMAMAPSIVRAADLNGIGSLKDGPSSPVAARSWSGCYAGAMVGYGVSKDKASLALSGVDVVTIDGLGSSGAVGGVKGGCDVQMGKIVAGLFGEASWHSQEFSVSSPLGGGLEGNVGLDMSWAIGGRLGYLVNQQTLVYAMAGYTQAQFSDMSATQGGTAIGSVSVPDAKGWMVGLGTEMALTDKLGLDLSYTYSHLDRVDVPIVTNVAIGFEPEVHQVRAGLVWHLF